ncbi:MAG: rhodanese-like domain-containing protein [Actinomycetota bacterium]|nr:rhodanese-like domain-containing protein [Actinomycetota bacterium]
MFFQQFYLEGLGHASYLVGSEDTGDALVLDPQRNVSGYFEAARGQGMRIRYGIDTHGHNDYLSGLAELAARQTMTVLGLADADLGYHHRSVRDGETIDMGEVTFEVIHTPGHTPEHLSLVVYDHSAGDTPALLLSGGALLVGDLARPDLLGSRRDAERAAETFCHTIQEKILTLPDHVEVFPTHVSGSLCGANIGSRLSTTVGYERRTNTVLSGVDSAEGFVSECIRLDNLPAVPPYWKRMRGQNLAGVPLLGVLGEPPALTPADFAATQADGAVVVDTRSVEAFGAAHIPGALNVGLSSSFATWAGTVLPASARVLLVLDRPGDLWEATWQLLRIGYPLPDGWLAGGMMAWRTAARPLQAIPQITVHDLKARLDTGELSVLDVRQPAEWAAGHIAGATFITGGELPGRLDDIPDTPVVATVCGSGYRSSVASSLLAARGHNVINVLGGMTAWSNAHYPTDS